ncbi:energy transducer TonB [Pseudoxanthomonas winnipegensis]|uniref:energy transducer TonB n=1 Tax=Pseudoxanthomonas winnipegensis TaxID=2480810 RepID=UPI0010406048|nr:energy transducer TonB [Pseudoxanthomonas winnipegensis]TBV77386.1 energy transducer TonB [Pseudoxanthomonas winnipegensis]
MSVDAPAPALRRWLLGLGLVLAAHALVIVALLAWPARTPLPPPAAPPQALMLELAPAPRAPPAAPSELPPGPTQRARQASARAAPPARPTPPPAPVAQAPAQPQTQPAPTPAQHEDATSDQAAAQASAPPSIAAPAADAYAAAQSLAGATAQAHVTWQAQLLGHLQRYKRYPRTAQRRRQEGVVQVGFAVDRRGHASEVHVVQGSGRDTLDAEALATVQRADPLPPPPADLPGDPVRVVVPVEFFLP